MSYEDRIEIKSIVGETLSLVDVDSSNHEIMLTTESGRVIRIYHSQDCCETVVIVGTDGAWKEIIGKVIVEASHDEESGGCDDVAESWTKTNLVFRVNDATVISRWLGTSNGYYSECVDIEEVTSKRD